jgi:acetyl esterase/lipase
MFGTDAWTDARSVVLISAVFFTWFFAAGLWTVNSLRRPVPPNRKFPPLWLPGMIVSELAPLYLVLRAVLAAGFVALGASNTPVGVAGLALFVFSELGAIVLIVRTLRGAKRTGRAPSFVTLFSVVERLPVGVERRVEVPYWNGLTLDLYRQPQAEGAPCLVYVHPGSWMRGRPGRQARGLIHRLAAKGWVVLDIRYPLSPAATFPDHLVGVKRALAWAKTEGALFGIDPGRVAVSGGSSGAHLAALAALTSGDPSLQPGFEESDTSVVACVPFYGIYDLLVRNPTRYDWPFVARYVLKATPETAPDLYTLGSPIDQVHADAPPFFVLHGELDSVVLPAESEHFVRALTSSGVETTYFEVPGAQHGFDAIQSLRTRAVAEMCVDWLVEKVGSTTAA